MPEWRAKTELISNLIPPGVKELREAIEKGTLTPEMAKIWSGTGSILGSPLGFLPFIGQLYSAGWGKIDTMSASKAFETFRLDPGTVYRLWWKLYQGKGRPEELVKNLQDQGWSPEQINQGLEATKVMPSPQDMVAFLAHEVYEPDMIAKYGLDDEWEKIDKSKFETIGLSKETALDYWRNHWQHASFNQVVEMRRRELIKDSDVWDWFRLVEIPPFWRPLLTELMWEVPTRVDIRRFLDMGTIDETRLRVYYGRLGYHGQDLEDYVLWTKVYNAMPDLIARYKNGWIQGEVIITELVKLGMKEPDAKNLYETKVKAPVATERIVAERNLTAAEIIKGVKKKILSKQEAVELLMAMGYEEWEAWFKIEINIEAQGSPETPLDYKHLVNSYRKSQGLPVQDIPEDLLNAEKAYFSTKGALVRGREENLAPEKLDQLEAEVYKQGAVYEVLKKQYGSG